jgi:hypothetical protein
MTTITEFPPKYPLTREHVIEIEIIGHLTREEWEADPYYDPDMSPCFDNFDFFVRLKDGRVYGFEASLPEFIREYMERENEDSFLSPGLVIIRNLSRESMMDAVERVLHQGLGFGYELEHYGVLQTYPDDVQE